MYLQTVILISALLFATPSLDDGVANSYCNGHRKEWTEIWTRYEVPADVAECVIFPELIRYSIFKDKMETGAVKAMYIPKGSGQCNFSIGRFQMKPSFVEELEKRWMRSGLARKYNLFFDTRDSEMSRRVRISRMEDENWQCIYLAVFLKMLYLDYGSINRSGERIQDGLDSMPVKEQVLLASTAYNHGCRWTEPGCGSTDELKAKSREKHFHLDFIPNAKTRYYAYGDISVRHWTKQFSGN